MSISKGIIIKESKAEKIISLPGNFNREKAKAPRIVVMVVQTTDAIITITELKKYFPKGAIENALIKFLKENSEGKNFGGN